MAFRAGADAARVRSSSKENGHQQNNRREKSGGSRKWPCLLNLSPCNGNSQSRRYRAAKDRPGDTRFINNHIGEDDCPGG